VRVRTSVGGIWLPEASRYSLRWVACSHLCFSACNHNVCCIDRPTTQRSPPSLLMRFVWSCSPPRCTLALCLCPCCGPVVLDSLGGLLPHSWGCQGGLGPSGSLSQFRLRKESSRSGQCPLLEAALALLPGALVMGWPLASRCRLLPSSLHVSAACPSFSLTPGLRV